MLPEPRFDHLERLTTPMGLFARARRTVPAPEHGYRLDDVSRGLIVAVRQRFAPPAVRSMVQSYLRFAVKAQNSRGEFHNRSRADGTWSDDAGVGDHWGIAIWAVGTASVLAKGEMREQALAVASRGMRARSPSPRSMAYAALGAVDVLRARPANLAATRLLRDARAMLPRPSANRTWPWIEPRLTSANAVIPEALMAIGAALDDTAMLDDGLGLLTWLLALQTRDGHLSVVPAGGWALGEPNPRFDQRPVEVAALAEACWRAHDLTGDPRWLDAVHRCADWFLGANDAGLALYDASTGGCSDALHADRISLDQGAESTLAALATLQLARGTAEAAEG